MPKSIPASALVAVIPGVLSPGGTPVALNSVFLTGDPSIPIGTVQAFGGAAAVAAWFGSQAPETLLANIYFAGTDISTQIPAVLYFAQYNAAAVAGYLRGAALGLTLAQLQAFSGTFTVSIDGVSTVTAAINLAGATSFTNAAALIQTGLQAGTPNNTATVTYDALRGAFVITSPTTGINSAISFATVSAFATNLKLTSAAGAVVSAGAAIAVPATLMGTIVGQQQNWAVFMTVVELDLAHKEAFAAWVQTTNLRYTYACQDSDASPTTSPNAAGSFGNIVKAANMDGIEVIYDVSATFGAVPGSIAAFFCAYAASINQGATNGNTTAAFRGQAGLVPQVADIDTYNNLIANGYNCYANFATSTAQFQEYQPGSISGKFLWANSYLNQIYFNSQLQQADMQLLKNLPAVPYNNRGQGLQRSSLQDPIDAALSFGTIVAGVALSAAQIAEVNNAAGVNIATTLQQVGWYLQILPAAPNVRTGRGSPPRTLWYTDGGSIQKLSLASIDVQ